MDSGRECQRKTVRQQQRAANGKLGSRLRHVPGHARTAGAVVVNPDRCCQPRPRPRASSLFMRLWEEGHDVTTSVRRRGNPWAERVKKVLGKNPQLSAAP